MFDNIKNAYYRFAEGNRSSKAKLKKIGQKSAHLLLYPSIKAHNILFSESFSKLNRKMNTLAQLDIDVLFSVNRIPYRENEPVRIVFIYQVASFWPSWDLFYHSVKNDPRFDVKVLWLNETVREKSQMVGAKEFIDSLGIPYCDYFDFDLDGYRPHIVVLQTPYDNGHRRSGHRTVDYKKKGYRVVYFPYGIEITDTSYSREAHFDQGVPLNAWRIYTFSDRMAKDYRKYCKNGGCAKGLGSPRLDALLDKQAFSLPQEVLDKADGRRIVLWKVHFPKIVKEHGKVFCATPDLNEYIRFSKQISNYDDLFFIFLPHPKFLDPSFASDLGQKAAAVVKNLETCENVYIDRADDYRPSLVNADVIISDRSAVLIEAATVGVPVLFMYNEGFQETFTQAVNPIVESYDKGTTCEDMIHFVEQFRENKLSLSSDNLRIAYKKAFSEIDGSSCERIKDDMISSIKAESRE